MHGCHRQLGFRRARSASPTHVTNGQDIIGSFYRGRSTVGHSGKNSSELEFSWKIPGSHLFDWFKEDGAHGRSRKICGQSGRGKSAINADTHANAIANCSRKI